MDDDVVRQAPLFAALDDEAAAALKATMTTREVGRGEVLFTEGDPGDRLYIIVDGKIKLGRASGDGRENLLAILGPGEMFGELSLFDPGPRNATATAVADTSLLGVGSDDLATWLNGRPDVARQLLRSLARRLRRTNEALADLVFSDVPGRVAKALLDLSERFGTPTDEGLRVTHDLTQEGWPSWSAPHARRSTRPWPTSPPAAGCAWTSAPSCCWTSTASAAAPADQDRKSVV